MQKYNLQKTPLKETKILQDIITLKLISSFNTSQNIIFQKSSYKNKPTTQGPKSLKPLYSIMNLKTISLPTLNSNVSYQMGKDAYNGDSRGYLMHEGPIHTWHCHFVDSQVLRTMTCCMFRAPFHWPTVVQMDPV